MYTILPMFFEYVLRQQNEWKKKPGVYLLFDFCTVSKILISFSLIKRFPNDYKRYSSHLQNGWGGGWVNTLKKETLRQKIFFQTMLNKVLKTCEKWHLLMQKLIKTTRNKRSSDCILQIFIRSTFKTWNTM